MIGMFFFRDINVDFIVVGMFVDRNEVMRKRRKGGEKSGR